MCQNGSRSNSVRKASRYPEILELGEWEVVFTLRSSLLYFFSRGEVPGVAGLVWCETMQKFLVLPRSAASGEMLVEPRENRWISAGIFAGVVSRSCKEERQKLAD